MDQVCPKTGCSSFENTMDKCDKGKLNKAFLYSYKYHQNVGIFDGFSKVEVAEFLNPQICQYIQGKKWRKSLVQLAFPFTRKSNWPDTYH